MPYSSSSIEIDIDNQINEFQEEDDETKNYDDDTGVDDECLNPMHT